MSKQLEIVTPDRREHCEEIIDLMAKAFPWPTFYAMRDSCRRGYLVNAHYDWTASRVGLMDGKVVTHWGVWDYRMRIGSARVRTGGIGGVATDGDYRKRGLMAATTEAGLQAMRECGYDMTILFGIPDFYHRFGYVRAWGEISWIVKVADLPSEPPAAAMRRFATRRDRDDIGEIYNRRNAGFTGTAVRPTFRFRDERTEGRLWADRRGKTVGYVIFRHRDDRITCRECGGDVEQILRVLGKLGRRRYCKEVRFTGLPFDHPLARRLRRGDCRTETRYTKSGSAMIRTIDLRSTLKNITGELSRRLRGSHLRGWRGELLIADPRDKVILTIGRSKVSVGAVRRGGRARHAMRGGAEIAQLLIGTHPPDEVVEANRTRLTGDARALIPVLFPDQHPVLGSRDRF